MCPGYAGQSTRLRLARGRRRAVRHAAPADLNSPSTPRLQRAGTLPQVNPEHYGAVRDQALLPGYLHLVAPPVQCRAVHSQNQVHIARRRQFPAGRAPESRHRQRAADLVRASGSPRSPELQKRPVRLRGQNRSPAERSCRGRRSAPIPAARAGCCRVATTAGVCPPRCTVIAAPRPMAKEIAAAASHHLDRDVFFYRRSGAGRPARYAVSPCPPGFPGASSPCNLGYFPIEFAA